MPKGGPVLDPLGLGVDVREADFYVLGPDRLQAPTSQVQAPLAGLGIVPDDWQRIGWRQFRAGREASGARFFEV
jgi:hypothetical protein